MNRFATRPHRSWRALLWAPLGLLSACYAPGGPTPDNRPPTVSAGGDRTVTLPADGVLLAGRAADPDGDPLTALWAQLAGPAEVTFADASALETSARFPEAGAYTLELSVTDGQASARDQAVITVEPGAGGAGAWRALPESAAPRQEVSYVQLGGRFYLAGGSTLHEVYDPVARTWTEVAPLPRNLDHIQGVAVGGKILYIGGNVGGDLRVETDTVYIYDPETDTFTEGSPMPRGRGAGGVAVHDGLIYYAGGLNGFVARTWFDVYDPVADTWTALPDMPNPRDHFHAVVLDGVFYAIGGREARINATTPAVDAFDIASGTWTTLDTELPTERGGFAAAVLGDEILVIGGEGGGNTYEEVEAYNPRTNTWRRLAPMPTPRHGVQAAVCNGGVYLAAGGVVQGIGPSSAHEVFFVGEPRPCEAP
ncbi:Kelch repeat-containing protein [Truepera radiovictrix]|uniref:Kelch repeat-containing protein n=1 Tax=Truepera radiovictrix (strain DSM 17093 / CIP 108686 / LMG 22925 / RQ-24) TaxID=649638 RepID=D7CSA2_TRURR|nr:kelch repeat-containing protein [Truepera radiovictrix]ADI13634.1 Kelch repeat-containing protein [Truepera radiovictrix DSM 17093]WMT57804.1 kelch repeat-containing protein [Truepera radiovictrix]